MFSKSWNVAKSFIDYEFSKISKYIKEAKLIGFSCSHYQLSGSLLTSSEIKNINPDVFIIVGGKDCSGAFGYELLSNIKYIDFIEKEFDILIDTSLNQIITFHYLVALSKAKMKVGKYSNRYDYYDFVIDVGNNDDFAYFVNQIKHYLCELNKKQ